MAGRDVDWNEVQGIVLSGYRDKPKTRYYLLTIDDAAAARAWLGRQLKLNTISFCKEHTQPDVVINIAFTLAGLEKIGLPPEACDTFPWDFRDGMTSSLRRRILGDFAYNDPSKWKWGGKYNGRDPDLHLLVLAHGPEAPPFDSWTKAFEDGWASAFELYTKLPDGYHHPDSREHFGFVDGVSQPAIETSSRSQKLRERGDIDGIIQPGEFVLGYVNERGQLPVSPSVAVADEPNSDLPVITNADRSVSGHPSGAVFPRLDFGRNGTFVVYRQLQQDVFAFAELVKNEAKKLQDGRAPPLSDEADLRRKFSAKIIGRWDDGTSLALAPNRPPTGSELATVNSFGYADEDYYGLRCPIGAHVRRANPRDTLDADRQVATRRIRRHRLLRRGRIYGERTFPNGGRDWHAWDMEIKRADRKAQRGLHFVAINASIESQFEFIQQTWMNTPFFGSLTDELDPLIGVPDEDDNPSRFTIQGAPINRRFPLDKPLVTVRGGAYFFLPSRAALKFLANRRPVPPVSSPAPATRTASGGGKRKVAPKRRR
jgi:deferrochelatase/peroxidase EfeB